MASRNSLREELRERKDKEGRKEERRDISAEKSIRPCFIIPPLSCTDSDLLNQLVDLNDQSSSHIITISHRSNDLLKLLRNSRESIDQPGSLRSLCDAFSEYITKRDQSDEDWSPRGRLMEPQVFSKRQKLNTGNKLS